MIMEILRDIVLWAVPDEQKATVECYTASGAAFMTKHWASLFGVAVDADDVNMFIDKAREEGAK